MRKLTTRPLGNGRKLFLPTAVADLPALSRYLRKAYVVVQFTANRTPTGDTAWRVVLKGGSIHVGTLYAA